MSLIVKAMHRFDRQKPAAGRGLIKKRPGRLRIDIAEFAFRPAVCVGKIAFRACDGILQGVSERKYTSFRIAWVFAGVMAIFVVTTVFRSISPIEASLSPGAKVAENAADRWTSRAGIARTEAIDHGLAPAAPVVPAAITNDSDFQSSPRDLALPLSRHVLKFVPPPANPNRTTAKPPQPSAYAQAELPPSSNPSLIATAYMPEMPEPQPSADTNVYQTAPAIKDPLIRLAGIACFGDQQSCSAVINGSTVRVGQTISGYTLVRIRSGEVLMQKNDDYWSLKMDRRN